jgi:hypothetical protein
LQRIATDPAPKGRLQGAGEQIADYERQTISPQ